MDEMSRFSLFGSSTAFKKIQSQVRKIAEVDATLLIEGETGTGKEMVARAIHYLGNRSRRPFVPVNCGALAESLVESELFGHERGAFTDAKVASSGLIAEADGGTLFLDEVDTLSLKAQAALLRFLQDRTYRRVGGNGMREADVRIVVASNANLHKLVESRQFRQDLLYRLNILCLHMPPLREREGDAVELAQLFLKRLSHQYQRAERRFHPDSLLFIRQYNWPGNVRELENAVHREFLMCEGDELRLGAADSALSAETKAPERATFKTAKARVIATFEREYVRDLLDRSSGNISRAARLAGQDRSAFGKLVRKHGLGQYRPATSRELIG